MEHSRSLLLMLLLCMVNAGVLAGTYDVSNYGAVGDGHTDDTKAFLAAWNATCADTTNSSNLVVPMGKTFLVGQLDFAGPCKSPVDFRVNGNILRPNQKWRETGRWITFIGINGLRIDGSGQFYGQGDVYWPCIRERACHLAPTTLNLYKTENVVLTGLKLINSSQMHVSLFNSSNVVISHLNITAPGDSPNTDGIHVEECQGIQIKNCNIGTGDDCISIGTGTVNLNISDVACGPGHGISIGSLGKDKSTANVEKIIVSNSTISGTTNGVRIKTWQGGSGYAKDIVFNNISLTAVNNPIIIDQFYCDHTVCESQPSAVKVSNVSYIGITGTSVSNVAINFNCSASVACEGIVMDSVNISESAALIPLGESHEALPDRKRVVPAEISICHNAQGRKTGVIVPDVPCLINSNTERTGLRVE